MLWKKESNSTSAMYVDLFRGKSVAGVYTSGQMSKIVYKAGGLFVKNDDMAEKCNLIGNQLFEEGRFIDAMEEYNKSLCFAENGSQKLALIYTNRSMCFLKLKMFKKCMADIELATQNQCLVQLLKILEKRKNDCRKSMETEDDQSDSGAAELHFEANDQFPCLANVVNIESSDEFGHRFLAAADIDIGRTVMVERCYVGAMKFDHYKACNICLKENQNIVPCKTCTGAMFCADCKDNDLHGIECSLYSGCPSSFQFVDVVRSISLAKNAFPNAGELIAAVEGMLKNDAIHPINLVDAKSKYRAFFQSSPDWRNHGLYLEQAYLFYRQLLEQNEMATFFHTDVHRRFLMHLVQHHILMILRGSFNKRIAPIGGVNITDTYINIVAKHLKHSCVPNVCHVLKGGSISCTVIRPIKKGDELFISYVTLHDFGSETQRRRVLLERYVNCHCSRCGGLPVPSNPQLKLDANYRLVQKMFGKKNLYDGLYDRKQIDMMKENCFDFLQKYGRQQCFAETYRIIDVLYLLLQ